MADMAQEIAKVDGFSNDYKNNLMQGISPIMNHSDFHSSYLLSPGSIPGRYELFWKELDYVKNLWKNRPDLKVEDAGIAALFGLECFAWYCAGEIVGRGFTFTGYYP
ncbi:mitochondrial ATP synthase subunit G protein [Actinidia rufa]|nr:mitochondrial ATP synthase subunit G protein [Actinidia rufa]